MRTVQNAGEQDRIEALLARIQQLENVLAATRRQLERTRRTADQEKLDILTRLMEITAERDKLRGDASNDVEGQQTTQPAAQAVIGAPTQTAVQAPAQSASQPPTQSAPQAPPIAAPLVTQAASQASTSNAASASDQTAAQGSTQAATQASAQTVADASSEAAAVTTLIVTPIAETSAATAATSEHSRASAANHCMRSNFESGNSERVRKRVRWNEEISIVPAAPSMPAGESAAEATSTGARTRRMEKSPYKDWLGDPWNNGVNPFRADLKRDGVPLGVTGVKCGIPGLMDVDFKPGEENSYCTACKLKGHEACHCPGMFGLAPCVNNKYGKDGWFRTSPVNGRWTRYQCARWDEAQKKVVWG